MAKISYRKALNEALHEEMERDDTVITFGEDVALYEGSFKVSEGLLKKFGEDRVFDTPISEAAIIGMATGAAMLGLRPVPELMTVNFAYVALDQIANHLALMRHMFGGQVTLPVTIRMPGGAGNQLGAQHSQSLEANLVQNPGLIVIYPSIPADSKALLKAAIRDDNPVCFIEHQTLYNLEGEVPDGLEPEPIGKARLAREGTDVTIVAYGMSTHAALRAADMLEKENVSAEVIDLRTLRPWDKEAVVASIGRTHHAVVVEETPPVCGIAAEIATNVYELAFDELDAPVQRVSRIDTPVPYARELEQACLPHPQRVVEAAKRTLAI
jgi:pyruvate dehydrogenase E1 component beta subunit